MRFAAFPSHFFVYKVQGSEFSMSMSDHIMQQVLQEFFAKKVSFSRKTAKLDSFVLPEWKNQNTYRKYFTYLESRQRGTLFYLICCTMYATEQPKEQPQIGDRGSYPVAINQFLIFSLYWVHIFSFSFFICQYSLFYVA